MLDANLHIRLLGTVEILQDGEPIELPRSRKARALLFYLISTTKSHSRKHLCDLFWEGTSDPLASLRWGLSKIRTVVNERQLKRIVTNGNKIRFNSEDVFVDYSYLKDLEKEKLSDIQDNVLQHAADLCTGIFLEDCEVFGCYRFETWLLAQRESTRNLQYKILSTWIDRLETEPEKAISYARKLLLQNPYEERAYIQLIELLGKEGYRKEALQLYNQCRNMLKSELNTTPAIALETARRKLLNIEKSNSPNSREENELLFPLVGRKEEQKVIFQLISKAEQKKLTELLLITGEPGIGKTRLLRELTDQVYKSDGSCLSTRAYSLEMSRPYAPWSELLRSVQSNMIPENIQKQIFPLLADPDFSSPIEGTQNRLFNGIVELLRILGSDRKPLAIIFDNLHWFDDPSLMLLSFVSREVLGGNTIIACATRSAELKENPLATQFAQNLRQKRQVQELELSSLSRSDIETLMREVNPDLDSQRVYQKSGGNPLFALELAFAFTKNNESLPDSLMNLIQGRFNSLDSITKTVLDWIAVWGHEISLELLAYALDYPASQLLEAIEKLERYNIIHNEVGEHYNFVHELVQDAAYQMLSEPRKKMIHRCIAKTMAKDILIGKERAEEIMHHANIGGEIEIAAKACLTAGKRALEMFAYKQVTEFLQMGLNHLAGISGNQRIALQIELLCLYINSGMVPFQPPDLIKQLRNCIGEARQAGLNAMVQKALDGISHFYFLKGDYHTALERMIKAEEAGRASDPVTMIKAIADTAKCYGMIDKNIDRAEELASEASKLAVELDLQNKIYDIPLALAFINHYKGQYRKAIDHYRTALQVIKQYEKDRWWEYLTLHRLIMFHLEQGSVPDALHLSKKLINITQKIGGDSEIPFSKALKALTEYLMNEQGSVQKLDSQLDVLRELDCQWMISLLQGWAAQQDLDCGLLVSAKKRAEEAVLAASRVNRLNDKAVATAVLVRLHAKEGNHIKAKELLRSVKKELTDFQLSFHARHNLDKITPILIQKN